MVKQAATAGKKSTSVPNTVKTDAKSTTVLVESDMFMLAIPSLKALVYTTVRVFGGLGTRQLRLHARHSGAEGLSPCCVLVRLWFWRWGF
jgi:hypothetical protein